MADAPLVWADFEAELSATEDGERLFRKCRMDDNFEFLLERMSDQQREKFEGLLRSGERCLPSGDHAEVKAAFGCEKFNVQTAFGNVDLIYRPSDVRPHWLEEEGEASMTLHPASPEDRYDVNQYACAIKEVVLFVSGWLRDLNIPFYASLKYPAYAYSASTSD